MAKREDMQKIIRQYKIETGKKEVDMHEVAKWAVSKGWQELPAPVDPLTRLAKDFSKAAREEMRWDEKTGKPYRANHAVTTQQGNSQLTFWIDIDEAPRKQMYKSLVLRREQMVGDGLQLTLDADHWNSVNPVEEPIKMEMDFTPDIEWAKNVPDDEEKAG